MSSLFYRSSRQRQSLYRQLVCEIISPDDKARAPSFHCPPFLPRDVVEKVVTEGNVQANASWLTSFFYSTFSHQIVGKAKNVFAILALCGGEEIIWDLFGEGLTDEDLPLTRSQIGDCCILSDNLDSTKGKKFESFSNLDDRAIDNFLRNQWLVLAPVLSQPGEHIRIDRQTPLPLYDIREISTESRSSIYRGRIHAAYMTSRPENPVEVAIKAFPREKDFWLEKTNLDTTRELNHPHLIRHIATVERGGFFLAIFPWADGGNLSDFWKNDPQAIQTRHSALFSWCIQQMSGIVHALCALHINNCRHGDLKPDNILHFKASDHSTIQNSQYGILVIADVGVSRVHHKATKRRTSPTNTRATTRCYEAPEAEFNVSPRSRRYDMWSVGCIFMEFLVWLLYGHDALLCFKTQLKRGNGGFSRMVAYYDIVDGATAIIHPAVVNGLGALRNDPRCGENTRLAEIIDLISHDLIVIDPEERMPAEDLCDRFRGILGKTDENPEYLVRRIEPPPSIPNPFKG